MIPLAKNIQRYFSLKIAVIIAAAVVLLVIAGTAITEGLYREVVIVDDGVRTTTVKTMKTTVNEVLEENGIYVGEADETNVALDSELQKKTINEITIKRAVPVYVQINGEDKMLLTCRETVEEALKAVNVTLDEDDRVEGAQQSDSIQKDMEFKVIKVDQQEVVENAEINFNVITKENNRLDQGKQNVLAEGQTGVKENKYKVTLENGVEVARQLISEAVISNPIDRIVEVGTLMNRKMARGDTIRYTKVLDMRATAYTASYKDTGKSPGHPEFGITATGMRARVGVIAVDPRVIPLGTKVYVEVAGNTPDYGIAIAGDTGGAIKGDLIDLYFDTQDFVDRWGVKRVKVYILSQ